MAFGSFDTLCANTPLPQCFLLGPTSSITTPPTPLLPTTCSARSIELANTIIFQAATDFAHIVALGMTAIMILHVRSKFTAVGRKEILTFFYIYLALTVVSLVLDAGVIESRSGGAYPWFAAVQNGLASSLCISLLVNGFVGFQLYEDGTTLSVWLLRLSSLGIFVISFAVSLLTFKSWAGLSPTHTTGLFVVLYVVNGVALLVYILMQFLLVLNTLQDRWPLGDLVFGVVFFVIGQVIIFVFGARICEATSHYLDGMFFATVCNLLAVMMVYKYWDSITKEDLEFSVGTKMGVWEVKEPLVDPSDDRRTSLFDLAGPGGVPATRTSTYDDYSASSAPGGASSTSVNRYSQNLSPSQPPAPSQPGHSRGQSRDGYHQPQRSGSSLANPPLLAEGGQSDSAGSMGGLQYYHQRTGSGYGESEVHAARGGHRQREQRGSYGNLLGNAGSKERESLYNY